MRAWQCSQDRVDGIVIQLEIFFLRSFPIADIWFVPDFPKPASSRHIAVSFTEMSDETKHEVCPLLVALGRISPAGVDRTFRKIVPVRFGSDGRSEERRVGKECRSR